MSTKDTYVYAAGLAARTPATDDDLRDRVTALADEWQGELDSGAIQDEHARYCWQAAARELRAALAASPAPASRPEAVVKAEALQEAADEAEKLQTFAHGNNPTSRAHVIGFGAARKAIVRSLRDRAASLATDPETGASLRRAERELADLRDRVTEYVVGFALDNQGRVALIRKNRPEWQSGRLNGIGGHVEPGETPADAMAREFEEETGRRVDGWEPFVVMDFPGARITFYRVRVGTAILDGLRTTTDETVCILDHRSLGQADIIPNLSWLVPLAAYSADRYEPIHIIAEPADTPAPPAPVVSRPEAVDERRFRDEWADYFDHWTQAVGPEPLTVETVIAVLRAEHKPFGVAASLTTDPEAVATVADEQKWTEKTVLDAIEPRYRKPGNGGSGEYAFMRQVRNDAGVNASRTFDAVAVHLWPSRGFQVDVIEVKVSRSDWLRELKDPAKAEAAFAVGDRFIVAAPSGIVRDVELPPGWGLIEVTPKRVRMTVQPVNHATGRREAFRAGFVIAMLRAAGAAALETSGDREVRRRVDEKSRELEADYRALTENKVQRERERADYALTVLEHARIGHHLDAADAGRKVRAALNADRDRDALVSVLRNQHDRLARMIADLEPREREAARD